MFSHYVDVHFEEVHGIDECRDSSHEGLGFKVMGCISSLRAVITELVFFLSSLDNSEN